MVPFQCEMDKQKVGEDTAGKSVGSCRPHIGESTQTVGDELAAGRV